MGWLVRVLLLVLAAFVATALREILRPYEEARIFEPPPQRPRAHARAQAAGVNITVAHPFIEDLPAESRSAVVRALLADQEARDLS